MTLATDTDDFTPVSATPDRRSGNGCTVLEASLIVLGGLTAGTCLIVFGLGFIPEFLGVTIAP